MNEEWRRLTRAAYVVAGHLDASAPDPDLDDPDAPTSSTDADAETPQRRSRILRSRGSHPYRRAPRFAVSASVMRAVGVVGVIVLSVLLVRACTTPQVVEVPARASVIEQIAPGEGDGGASGEAVSPGEEPGAGENGAGMGGEPPAEGDPAGESQQIVVHVAGAVHTPGVVSLPAGARVGEAVTAAGGPLPGAQLDALNLARPLGDGEQIRVPAEGEEVTLPPPSAAAPGTMPGGVEAGSASGAGSTGVGTGALIDLNSASSEQLQTLPGIGPALAGRIIDHREQVGGFTDVEQLIDVSGIGPAVMGRVRDKVTVAP